METPVRNHSQGAGGELTRIKRRHPRVDVQGFVGDIADGNYVLEGIVEDISSGGFRMSNVPGAFSAGERSYTTVISGNGKHYRVVVIPCWTKKVSNDRSIEVGFKIVEAPWEWTEFVLNTVSSPGPGTAFSFQA